MFGVVRFLSLYAYLVNEYRPESIVNFAEGYPWSSIMTAFLREKGIRHINMMHGEFLYSANGAFCEFDEFHVWGEHFRDICMRQYTKAEQFHVTGSPDHRDLFWRTRPSLQPRPYSLLIIHSVHLVPTSNAHSVLLKVLSALDESWEIRIRPHPAKQNWPGCLSLLNTHLVQNSKNIRVQEESPEKVPLEQALQKSRVVVGVASMALIEAWIAGCKVMYLQDIVDKRAVYDRHRGSRNTLFVDESTSFETIREYMTHPAFLDNREAMIVDQFSSVLDLERRAPSVNTSSEFHQSS
jgi:hypothetical protein